MIIRRAFNKFPEESFHVQQNLLLDFARRSVYSTEVVLFPYTDRPYKASILYLQSTRIDIAPAKAP